jgi:hypothetical protein
MPGLSAMTGLSGLSGIFGGAGVRYFSDDFSAADPTTNGWQIDVGGAIANVGGALVITPQYTEESGNPLLNAWTAGAPDGYTEVGESAPNREITEVGTGVGHGGGGTGSANLYNDGAGGANNPYLLRVTTANRYYDLQAYLSFRSAGALRVGGAGIFLQGSAVGLMRISHNFPDAALVFRLIGATGDFTIDTAYMNRVGVMHAWREMDFVNARAGGVAATWNTNTCFGPTHYVDVDNWVAAHISRTNVVQLVKVVAGTWTEVASAVVVPVAGVMPVLQRDGNFYSVDYNGATVINDQAVNDAVFTTARKWGWMSTDERNTLDEYTWAAV